MKEEGIFSLEKILRIETVFASKKKKKKERKNHGHVESSETIKPNKTDKQKESSNRQSESCM